MVEQGGLLVVPAQILVRQIGLTSRVAMNAVAYYALLERTKYRARRD